MDKRPNDLSEKEKQERARIRDKEQITALNKNCLLMTALLKRLKIQGVNRIIDSQRKELESMGVKVQGLFQEIEPETLEVAKLYAEFYIKRYKQVGKMLKERDPQKFEYYVKKGWWGFNLDGTLPEDRIQYQRRMGITQKAFEIALQQLQIPYIPNDPAIDWRPPRERKDPLDTTTKFRYDFYIPFFGEIDIKSATLEKPAVSINAKDFGEENPEFVIAYQILDMNEPRWLKLAGFLSNSEVKEHPTSKSGNIEYYPITIEDFETKHGAEELCDRLLFVRAQIEKAS